MVNYPLGWCIANVIELHLKTPQGAPFSAWQFAACLLLTTAQHIPAHPSWGTGILSCCLQLVSNGVWGGKSSSGQSRSQPGGDGLFAVCRCLCIMEIAHCKGMWAAKQQDHTVTRDSVGNRATPVQLQNYLLALPKLSSASKPVKTSILYCLS